MLIREQKVFPLFLAAQTMKLLLVQHQRYLMRIKIHSHEPQAIRILSVKQEVPGVARTRPLEHSVSIRHTAKYVRRTHIRKKDLIDVRDIRPGRLPAQ